MKQNLVHSLQSAKVKSLKGMRYSTDWLLECLLLKIKSPGAYRHLRNQRILPLPHPATISRLIAGQRCEFGVNSVAMDAIARILRDKPRRDCQGVLVFDEIKLRETLEYNSATHKMDGFVDFGEHTYDILKGKNPEKLANHALVIMFRPLNDNWVQPIAAYATKDAASGTAIQKIIMDAIIRLEAIGAEVVMVICDGSKPNKSFWKQMGIGLNGSEIVNKIVHPCDDNRFLYFGSDTPHIFKCIRNHCQKYTFVDYFGEEVDFSYYGKLLTEDTKRNYGLRKCPKLSKSHVNPNSFEKMVVPLATQLFSRSVSTGLSFYRQMGVPEFENCIATEKFTQEMNDVFDMLNAKLPSNGIRVDSVEYNKLKLFLKNLELYCNQKGRSRLDLTFASEETLIGLRVSIATTLDVIDYLVKTHSYEYVLTGKLNQDCLENFFGCIRAAGGHEEHPTITNFCQLFRLLSLYAPVKQMLKGNVRSDESDNILASFTKKLRVSRKERIDQDEEQKAIIEDLIVQKLLESENGRSIQLFDDRDDLDILDKNIVHYLAGFLCFKANKFTTCKSCISSMEASSPNDSFTCVLTSIVDYGRLHYPSDSFLNLILSVEQGISTTLAESMTFGDIMINCIQNIKLDSVQLGCTVAGHKEMIVTGVVPYYITMRMHFYTRSVRNKLGHGKATKTKRKESKLKS